MSKNLPTCPTGCSDVLPAVDFNFCDPQVSFGEIQKIYVMAYDGTQLTDWTSQAEWLSRIDNTDVADPDKIREFTVSGDKPVPEKEDIVISGDRRITTPATHTVNFDIDDVTDDNYTFARTMECNTKVRVWYATEDYMFGHNEGIVGTLRMDYTIERGQKTPHKIMGVATWEEKFSPERIDNPLT